MRPKQQPIARHDAFFRSRLDQIINLKHELVALAERIDWAWINDELAGCFSDVGLPAEPALHDRHVYVEATPAGSPMLRVDHGRRPLIPSCADKDP
jgi:IS5 family transposase